MAARLLDLPFIVILMGIGAASMMIPATHAVVVGDFSTARSFFYASLLFLILFAFIAVATSNDRGKRPARGHLVALVGAYTVLPVMLAVPFYEAVGATSFLNSYIEMVSSFTTTGATLYEPGRLAPSVHLWRAQVGWMGGFFVWVTAVAVLAPMNLGGFEVRSSAEIGQGAAAPPDQITWVADTSERLRRFAAQLFPIYTGLTAVLWAGLILAGDEPLVALSHAMSTLSTSGISPVGGLGASQSGFGGELLILLFLVFALTRLTYAREERSEGWRSLGKDPELRLGLAIIAGVSVVLFLRHWAASFELEDERDVVVAFRAFWGGVFTVASFLTTTGFDSANWDAARAWSGLEAPGLILMGLAVFGGGVATTAGGVKLLRVYALYMHGKREVEKLVYPSSIGGAGPLARQLRRQGAYVSWIFFMLFAMSIALVMSALSLTGQSFENALLLTIASLSTTGPLLDVAVNTPIRVDLLSDTAKLIVAAAMVIGRLETLALIALFNPDIWRG
jgi:trk system potassium uptake protein TrkH